MKKIVIFFFIIIFLISACTPQVTITSEVTVTSQPIETVPVITPTLYVESTTFQEAQTTTIVNGLELVLGEPDENGNRSITKFVPPEDMYATDATSWLEQFDETRLGLEGDWVQMADGRVVLLDDINDPASVLAEHKLFEQTGTMQVVVDGNKLAVDKENVILSKAEVREWRNGLPVDYEEVFDLDVQMAYETVGPTLTKLFEIENLIGTSTPAGYILSSDGTKGVSLRYAVLHVDGDQNIARQSSDGIVFFRNAEGGYTYFFVENFKLEYID